MNILIIGFAKIKYMPYLNLYLENIDREKNNVHLVYWNRDLKPEDTSKLQNITKHEFWCYQEDDVSKISKISSFIKFRKFVNSVLKDEFDFVVVLHSLPGVLLYKELITKYKNRFIFDYRDFTYENFGVYKSIIHSLVEKSYKTFVSSDAFRRILPEKKAKKILTSHNMILSEVSYKSEENSEKSEKIRIGFWGFIREEKVNVEIIRKIGNDSRFELHYYGREQNVAKKLKEYVRENAYENIFFHGEYKPEERYDFAKKTDIIHNVYAEDSMMSAMSNKYYDGAIFKIPQILMTNSFMAKNAEKSGIGFAVNPFSDSFSDDIYDYCAKFDRNIFIKNCEAEIKKVTEENGEVIKVIRGIGDKK